MKENGIAKTLQVIGIIEILCGIIVGLVILASGDNFRWLGIVVMIVSFITCMIFWGFAEIINLLQKNINKQDELLLFLNEQSTRKDSAPKSVIQDIESNLPEM